MHLSKEYATLGNALCFLKGLHRKEESKMNNQDVLAVVGGDAITNADLDLFLQGVPQEQRRYASNPQFRGQFLDQLISYRSFAKYAEELKLDETEENIVKNYEILSGNTLVAIWTNNILTIHNETLPPLHRYAGTDASHCESGDGTLCTGKVTSKTPDKISRLFHRTGADGLLCMRCAVTSL
jgi:hypothetical protein